MEFISNNLEQTNQFAEEIATKLKGGEILALSGNLGAGKTAFVKALAKSLGINETIISPTFNLVKSYSVNKHKTIETLSHFDVYRLSDPRELIDLGIEDLVSDKHNISVIEWADKFKDIFPSETIWISFEYIDENRRKIIVRGL